MNPLLQNLLIVSVMLGFAGMEWASRRYKNTVNASADDTKLELAMFLSLIAVAQPLAILVTGKLSTWLMPEQRDALADRILRRAQQFAAPLRLGLGAAQLGLVGMADDEAAIGQRVGGDVEDAAARRGAGPALRPAAVEIERVGRLRQAGGAIHRAPA